MTARILLLFRSEPAGGQAGGVVAEAVVFTDGTAVLHWLTEPRATEAYPSEEAMRQVREASGRSVFLDDYPPRRVTA